MKAIVFQDDGTIACQSGVEEPTIIHPRDVIVEVMRAGICGSDLHLLEGREPLKAGTIFGHELAGIVVEVGREVSHVSSGDRVLSPFSTSCGRCFHCVNGLTARCVQWQVFGHDDRRLNPDPRALNGAQAEYVRVPLADSTLVPMPTDMDFDEGVLMADNFATGWDGLRRAQLHAEGPIDVLAVIGCGVVGICTVLSAIHHGVRTVIAIDPVAYRREKVESLSHHMTSSTVIAVSPQSVVEVVRDLCAERAGVDAVVEAVGRSAALELAFELVRDYGVIASIGAHTENSPINLGVEYSKNVVRTAGRASVRSCLDVIIPQRETNSLSLPLDQLITDSALPLESAVESYRKFQARSPGCLKMTLAPHE